MWSIIIPIGFAKKGIFQKIIMSERWLTAKLWIIASYLSQVSFKVFVKQN